MKNENEEKRLLRRLVGNKNSKRSCCCNFEVEELPEENSDNKDMKETKKDNGNSCCR